MKSGATCMSNRSFGIPNQTEPYSLLPCLSNEMRRTYKTMVPNTHITLNNKDVGLLAMLMRTRSHLDPQTSIVSIPNGRLAYLEEQARARQDKKNKERERAQSAAMRRRAVEQRVSQRREETVDSKERRISAHQERLSAIREREAAKLHEQSRCLEQEIALVRHNQSVIGDILQTRARQLEHDTDEALQRAADRRRMASQQRSQAIRVQMESKAAESEHNRKQICEWEHTRSKALEQEASKHLERDIESAQRSARNRNAQIEARQQKAAEARERYEHFKQLSLQKDYYRMLSAEAKKREIAHAKSLEAERKKLEREERSRAVKESQARVNTYHEFVAERNLEKFEAAKVIGEMARTFQKL